MKRSIVIFFLFIPGVLIFGQLFKGPKQGTVAGGAIVNTNAFEKFVPVFPEKLKSYNKVPFTMEADYTTYGRPGAILPRKYLEDRSTMRQPAGPEQSILEQSFIGLGMTNSIPPDPYMAVGPEHIIGTVNTSFGIWDKKGTLLKTISADSWFGSTVGGVSSFDPKVMYDQFDKRWIMVWLDLASATSPSRSNIFNICIP